MSRYEASESSMEFVAFLVGGAVGGAIGGALAWLRYPDRDGKALLGLGTGLAVGFWLLGFPYIPALLVIGFLKSQYPDQLDGSNSELELAVYAAAVAINAAVAIFLFLPHQEIVKPTVQSREETSEGSEGQWAEGQRGYNEHFKANETRNDATYARPPYGQEPVDLTPPTPSEGWYRDPGNPSQLRYWDGQRWSQHTQSAPPTN